MLVFLNSDAVIDTLAQVSKYVGNHQARTLVSNFKVSPAEYNLWLVIYRSSISSKQEEATIS